MGSKAKKRPVMAREEFLVLRCCLILALGMAVYWPALTGEWLWDDRNLILTNSLLHEPGALWKIWFEPEQLTDYFPLEVSATWVEWEVFGTDTLGYHLVNLALHLTGAFLFWRLLRQLAVPGAWLGALIFTVHPVLVESVAWISELKNTLSLPLFLLAMSAWIDYDAHKKPKDYALALVLFLLAMLTKPAMAMFPCIVLLFAWWRRGSVSRRDLLSTIPFFAISLGLGLVTLRFLAATAVHQHAVPLGPWSRLACAGLSIAFYFCKCVLPVHLMPIYPKWNIDPPSPWQFLPWPIFAGTLFFFWTRRATWGRHALLGLGFFLLNLVPFIGLISGSYMKSTWVMDHIVYIPILGLIGLFVAAIDLLRGSFSLPWRSIVLVPVVGWMAWSANRQAMLYDRSIAMWEYNSARVPDAALPHYNLGVNLAEEGRFDEALAQFHTAEKLDGSDFNTHYTLGLFLARLGRFDEGIAELRLALNLWPDRPETHYSLGSALHQAGHIPEAIEEFRKTIAIDPKNVLAYHSLAVCLANEGQVREAMDVTQSGLQVAPEDPNLQADLATIRRMQTTK